MPNFFGFASKKSSSKTGIGGKKSKECRVLMLGLDGAGKTALLYRWKLGEVITTIPTIGFNVETCSHMGKKLTIWDVGGQSKIRPLWKHYVDETEVLIWAVDASDPSTFAESAKEFDTVMKDFGSSSGNQTPPVVFALNKSDKISASDMCKSRGAFEETFVVDTLKESRQVEIVECSSTQGDGTQEVLDAVVSCVSTSGALGSKKKPTTQSYTQMSSV